MSNTPELRFLQWLCENGASFPNIQWPILTQNGIRGAMAIADIATHDVMITIPKRLMITEATCLEDPHLKHVYQENRDIFSRDDPVIALFLVRELVRGEESFYFPYLSILPPVVSIQDWSPTELSELRDTSLVDAAVQRAMEIKAYYRRITLRLSQKYPDDFPPSEYTFERFSFAWKTIQARTFGRRLPWTALVPFADCLNHSNVATKYDYNVDNNGCFRLFPSGTTSYKRGSEVFNSYGRRPNSQLLLDYGFALPMNEWEFVEIELPSETKSLLGSRFPYKKKLKLDLQTRIEQLFPLAHFPVDVTNSHIQASNESDYCTLSRSEVLCWFRSVLMNNLAGFETSKHNDELRLLQESVPERVRSAVVYRLGRMNVIESMIKQLDGERSSIME